ncbi:hypothetical protein ALC62_00724 [Cyphomyrmex costatus]|uniref:Uncharacterized protein n=1 Tax=Cyphomyrmex costatus TaxID=456900 RepID=A0A151IQ54_9HYME|nr:hypothetical protein ALC62_00724 [Cyphomyrmex costatus]
MRLPLQLDFCSVGENSWCLYEKAKVINKLSDYKHNSAMHKDVFKAVKLIYEELNSDKLPTKCIGARHTRTHARTRYFRRWSARTHFKFERKPRRQAPRVERRRRRATRPGLLARPHCHEFPNRSCSRTSLLRRLSLPLLFTSAAATAA